MALTPGRSNFFNKPSLSVNVQINTNTLSVQSHSVIKAPFIPASASDKEKTIHHFLSDKKCFQINIKTMLEEEGKIECASPKLMAI